MAPPPELPLSCKHCHKAVKQSYIAVNGVIKALTMIQIIFNIHFISFAGPLPELCFFLVFYTISIVVQYVVLLH